LFVTVFQRVIHLDPPSKKHPRTGGRGVDTAIEAVGVPASFVTCEDIVAPRGVIANIGVHGVKADLHLERLWDCNNAITTRLVDTVTTPMLLKTVQAHRIAPQQLITHRFKIDKRFCVPTTHSRRRQKLTHSRF
jgi:alcohol dehydrogenase